MRVGSKNVSEDGRRTAPNPHEVRAAAVGRSSFVAWVRYRGRDLRLAPGATVLGRSASCQIILDDGLVSRRHAQLVFEGDSLRIEDLESVNGVFVNGVRIEGQKGLGAGDRVLIGKQEMTVHTADAPPMSSRATLVQDKNAETLSGLEAFTAAGGPPREDSEATRKGDAFDLLGGVAEKILALGRGEEAERILAGYLKNLLAAARRGDSIDEDTRTKAATFAVKLANATGKGSWVDYAVQLFTQLEAPLPASVVDELYTVLRSISAIDLSAFRAYLSLLKARTEQLSPADRFVVQRLEGLERLAASR